MILQIPVLFFALLIDRMWGDPKTSFHPVALIGRFIGLWGRPENYSPSRERPAGITGWLMTVLLFCFPFLLVQLYAPWYIYLVTGPFLLKICFAWRSLEEHAHSVVSALSPDERAKQASYLVSRDTTALSDEQVLSAAYESVAENLNDSIIAPLFWFCILGLPGAALYRAANTMDAMLGYTDERIRIGWFPARMDDILSYIPARICGAVLILIYAAKKRYRPAITTFQRDRKKRPGFNGGIPMSLIAGGEGIMFEKPGVYRIGTGSLSLQKAGPSIIRTIQISTILFCVFAGIALVLLDGVSNIYGI